MWYWKKKINLQNLVLKNWNFFYGNKLWKLILWNLAHIIYMQYAIKIGSNWHIGRNYSDPISDLVCPILWTRPIAWSSVAGFRMGSTSNTWVASTIFRPLQATFKGNKSVEISASNLKSRSLVWKRKRHLLIEDEHQLILILFISLLFFNEYKKFMMQVNVPPISTALPSLI